MAGMVMTGLSFCGLLWINDFMSAHFKDAASPSNKDNININIRSNSNSNSNSDTDVDTDVGISDSNSITTTKSSNLSSSLVAAYGENPNEIVIDAEVVKNNTRAYASSTITGDTSKHNSTHTNNNVYLFHADPTHFLDEFEGCIRDVHCQVFYHHVQKASGTFIGSVLFGWMNNRFANPMRREGPVRPSTAVKRPPPRGRAKALMNKNAAYKRNNNNVRPWQPLQQNNNNNKRVQVKMPPNNNHHSRRRRRRRRKLQLVRTARMSSMRTQQRQLAQQQAAKVMSFDGGKWCCYGPLMDRLRLHPEDHCRYKFSSWEVNADQIGTMLDTCFYNQTRWRQKEQLQEQQKKESVKRFFGFGPSSETPEPPQSKDDNNKDGDGDDYPFTRAVVLMAYREPIDRTVSLIHQLCNNGDNILLNQIIRGNWNSLEFAKGAGQEVVDACHRCSYTQSDKEHPSNPPKHYTTDAQVWDCFVRDTNKKLKGISQILQAVTDMNRKQQQTKELLASGPSAVAPARLVDGTFIMDTKDVTSFFEQLQKRFPTKRFPKGNANTKRPYRVCHWDMDKAPGMVKNLSPSTEIYSNLTIGLLR
jgi:hypothetical protein